MNADLIDVRLAEDDPGDVVMICEAFADHEAANRLSVGTDGGDAMALLRRAAGSPTRRGRT